MKRRVSERPSAGGVLRGAGFCALLCGGCLSAAHQGGGGDAVGRLYADYGGSGPGDIEVVLSPAQWGSSLPGRWLVSAGDDDEPIQAITNSGWRMGALYLTGVSLADIVNEWDTHTRVFSVWGYQFQFQAGKAGSTVGLVEVVPLLMGMDQSLLIPAVNLLVAARYRHFEFGIGPHFSPMAELAQDPEDEQRIKGLGLAGVVGYWFRKPGGVNLSVDLSFMLAGDLAAVGIMFGWNFAD